MPIPREEETEEKPVERKRRRPKPQPVDGDEGTDRRKEAPQDGEEDEESLSTGIVVLDIVLDFRDDCIDWAKIHRIPAMIIAGIAFLLFIFFVGLSIRHIINVINRPTLALAVTAYDYGSFQEAKTYAESVLKYVSPDDILTRSGALFVMGAATCAMADLSLATDRQSYYLAAANYLREAAEYDFLPDRRTEGFFLLGKSLYMSGELVRCREPLRQALQATIPEKNGENVKAIYWFLANSFFLDSSPDYVEAMRALRAFRKQSTLTEEEGFEADLLEAMIQLQLGRINAADQAFAKVPSFDRFETMRAFVSGQLAFFKAREIRQKAIDLETSRGAILIDSSATSSTPTVQGPLPDPTTTVTPDLLPLPISPSGEASPVPAPVSPIPSMEPSTPLEKDDLEKLLPKTPAESKSGDGAKNPARSPVHASWDRSTSIFQRVAWMQDQSEEGTPKSVENVVRHATPTSESAVSTADEEKKAKPYDPNAILVMPSEEETSKGQRKPHNVSQPVQTMIPVDPRFQQAKALRLQAAAEYRKAIEKFKIVAFDERFQPRWQRQAILLQGIAYDEMDEPVKAQEHFAQLVELSPETPEAVAAEFYWAEIERQFGRSDTAQAAYARAFESLRKMPNYANPWLPKSRIEERSRDALRQRIVMKEYKDALSLLKLLKGVLPEPEIVRNTAIVYEQWAEDLQRQANASFREQRTTLQTEAFDKFRRAGEAYDLLASLLFDSSEYARLLWASAENYRLGKDYRRGILEYKQYLKANTRDRQAEALVFIGEMYIHLDGLDEAVAALERCLEEYPNHPMVPRARLDLSRAYSEKKEWDKARKLLELNLIGEYAPTAAVYRDSIYALGKLSFEHGDLNGSIPKFEDALKIHPKAVQAPDAHYYLALAFLRRSDDALEKIDAAPLESTKRKLEIDSQADRMQALEHLFKAEEMLVKRQDDVGLSEAELLMLRNTFFSIGAIQMKLKLYEQAILTYDLAATRYQSRPEAIDALLQIAIAYRMLGRPQDAIPILNRARILLDNFKKANLVPENNNWDEQIETQKNLAMFRG